VVLLARDPRLIHPPNPSKQDILKRKASALPQKHPKHPMLGFLIAIILFCLSSGFYWPTTTASSDDIDREIQRERDVDEMKQLAYEAKEFNFKHYAGGYFLGVIFLFAISSLLDFLLLWLSSGQGFNMIVMVAAVGICFSSLICGFIAKLYAYARILHANNLQQEAFWIGVSRSLQFFSWLYAIIKTIVIGIFIFGGLAQGD
jgi:hypothetical protein